MVASHILQVHVCGVEREAKLSLVVGFTSPTPPHLLYLLLLYFKTKYQFAYELQVTVPPALIVWHTVKTGPSRTEAKLRGILVQQEPQMCSVHDPSAYGHSLALTNLLQAMSK